MKTRFLGKLALVLFLLSTMVACGNTVDLEEEITPEDAPVNGDMDQEDVMPHEDESIDEGPISEDSETNIEENSNTEEPALHDIEPEESLNSEDLDPEMDMEEVK